jgi:hypothetical protein
MPFKDKETMMSYRRNYYRQYYHKNKPENVKSSSIKNGSLLFQYHKVLKVRSDFVNWMCRIKNVNDEFLDRQSSIN